MNLNKLKGLRAEKELTQKDMAEKLGISSNSYLLKENGKREFSASEVHKMAEIFKVEESYFFAQ